MSQRTGSRTSRPPTTVAATKLIPRRALVAAGRFSPALSAAAVAAAVSRGLVAGGLPAADLYALGDDRRTTEELLRASDFDVRMRAARALIVCSRELREETLTRSATFALATRARQGGVPAYAVTAENLLDPFDARMLDLQLILEARTARGLFSAGRRLAAAL